MPDNILDLIEDKVADLDDLKARVEGRLFRLTLTSPRSGERVTPQISYPDWLVVSLFRHWLAENLTPQPPTPPKTPGAGFAGGGHPAHQSLHGHQHQQQLSPSAQAFNQATAAGRPFRLLGQGGPAYLGHEEVKKFVKTARAEDYSREGLRRFERRLDELKAAARETVKPLMRNYLELEEPRGGTGGGAVGLGYLSCTKVEEGDYPW